MILVSGLVNIETNLKIEGFPLNYYPVCFPFFGIKSNVSGVGTNIAKALTKLGSEISFLSLIGRDLDADLVIMDFQQHTIDTNYLLPQLEETSKTVILFDHEGKRQIHCDLKDLQEQSYPKELFLRQLEASNLAILTPLNYNREFLMIAKSMNKLIATDLHVIYSIHDAYNRDFMEYADILFFSNESVIGREESFIQEIANAFNSRIIVCGMGKDGCLLYVREEGTITHIEAIFVRPVVNTIGAGDALFSAFIHFYLKGDSPRKALEKATYFAAYKIGESGASLGFLSEAEVEAGIEARIDAI